MTSLNSILIRSAAASTIATAALLSLTACGPQSGATPTVAAAPAGAQQQAPYPGAPVPQSPAYAGNNVPPPPNGQAVPAPNGYYGGPAPQAYAPPAQTYAPPVQVAQQAAPREAPRAVNSASHGEISGIEPIRARPQGSGAGAVVGGVLGAVVGNQFGHGTGRTALTVLGAGGGAVAGNNVERNLHEQVTGYRISVRLDNGQLRIYEETQLDGLRVGDRVRVEGHRLVRT